MGRKSDLSPRKVGEIEVLSNETQLKQRENGQKRDFPHKLLEL